MYVPEVYVDMIAYLSSARRMLTLGTKGNTIGTLIIWHHRTVT